MKKRFLYGFLITVLLYCILAVGVSASGEVVSEGLEFTLNDDGVSYSVTGIGTCTGTDVIIPSEYEGLPVAKIGEAAFDGGTFSSITIPDSISFIGNDAFLRCSNLSRVNINSLTSWCNIEFQYESEYEDGVTYYSCYSNPLVYAHNLFIDGIQVTELVIPNEISEIKAFAFNGGNITQLTLHSNIDCIGIGAFMTCYGFSKLVIPEGVTNIEDNAFVNCKFTSVSIPTTLIEIGNNAFYNCTNLEAVYITDLQAWCNIVFNWEDDWDEGYWQSCDSNPLQYANNLYIDGKLITNFILPESITSLNPYVFQGASFNSVTLHDKITYIPDGAFCECSQMTEIYIPDTVTSIGDYSFIYCSKLEMLILNNVTTVGYNSVWGCNSIRAIYFKNTMPSGMDTEPNYFYKDDVICGYYVFENNDSIYGLKDNEITLLHSPKNISSSFEIPSSVEHEDEKYTVTSIAGKAFYECSDLERPRKILCKS